MVRQNTAGWRDCADGESVGEPAGNMVRSDLRQEKRGILGNESYRNFSLTPIKKCSALLGAGTGWGDEGITRAWRYRYARNFSALPGRRLFGGAQFAG